MQKFLTVNQLIEALKGCEPESIVEVPTIDSRWGVLGIKYEDYPHGSKYVTLDTGLEDAVLVPEMEFKELVQTKRKYWDLYNMMKKVYGSK